MPKLNTADIAKDAAPKSKTTLGSVGFKDDDTLQKGGTNSPALSSADIVGTFGKNNKRSNLLNKAVAASAQDNTCDNEVKEFRFVSDASPNGLWNKNKQGLGSLLSTVSTVDIRRHGMRSGLILGLLALAEIGIGSSVWDAGFKSGVSLQLQMGAFWTGLCSLAAAFLSIFASWHIEIGEKQYEYPCVGLMLCYVR